MRLAISSLAMALAIASECVYAASFDCKQASTELERQVCEDATLSKQDDDLASAYKRVLGLSPAAADTKEEQRRWIQGFRNQCKTKECLARAYQSRTEQLLNQAERLPFKPDMSRPSVVLGGLATSKSIVASSKPLKADSAELVGRIEFGHDAAGGRWDFASGTINLTLRYVWQVSDEANKHLHRLSDSGAFVLVRGRTVNFSDGGRRFDDGAVVSIYESAF